MKKLKYLLLILPFLFINSVNADTFVPTSKLQYYEGHEENLNNGNTSFHEDSYNYGTNITPPLSPGYAEHPFAISLILNGSYKAGNTYIFTATLFADIKGSTFKFYYPNLLYMAWFARLGYKDEKITCNFDMITENSRFDITCSYQPTFDSNSAIISFVNHDWRNNGYLTYDDLGTYFKWDNINIQLYSDSSGAIIEQNQVIIDQNNTIINQNNQQLQEQKKTNETLTDDNVNISESSITDNSASVSDSPISDLLILPVKLLTNISNGLQGTCTSFNLGSLFGTDLILPCINLESRLGSFLWGLIDSLFCIFLVYNVGMLAIKIWTDVIMMKDVFSDLYKPSSEKKGGENK